MNKTMIQKHNQILSYGRFGSKTTFKFEKAISNEGAHTTVATSSGTAAIVSSFLFVKKWRPFINMIVHMVFQKTLQVTA